MVAFAQISDIHIGGSPASEERAAAVLRHVDSLGLDAILVTGDIADHALPEEYDTAAALMRVGTPLIVCPGNHDSVPEFDKRIGPANQVLRLDAVTLALADSSVPGEAYGFLADETLAWLDEVLAERPGVPAFVGLHHPPVPLGIPYVDRIALREPERLADVLARHPHVTAVLAGHAHTAVQARFAGLPLVVAPGVVSTCLTSVETADTFPVSYELPPAFALHLFDGGNLVTHFRPVVLK
ncbi:metallophosphoesterase [Nonomuraea ferruginea]|uniref:Metallophosphoesterase n=1 Tax=Nonomuraea ferruginea TaxID=46174 RepID=A0ABT4TB09_9ACTN|nr:metallophosphoesterase [Nonomuraea ferruginea]MDA0646323.1 metallophosphoesterase [Nonomuraea ferruginea]